MKLRRIFALFGIIILIIGFTPVPHSNADICEWDDVTEQCKG